MYRFAIGGTFRDRVLTYFFQLIYPPVCYRSSQNIVLFVHPRISSLAISSPIYPSQQPTNHTMHFLTFTLFLLLQTCSLILSAPTSPLPQQLTRREFHSAYQALYNAVSDEDILGKAIKVSHLLLYALICCERVRIDNSTSMIEFARSEEEG